MKKVYVLMALSTNAVKSVAGVFSTKKEIREVMKEKGYKYSKNYHCWYKKGEMPEYYIDGEYKINDLFFK